MDSAHSFPVQLLSRRPATNDAPDSLHHVRNTLPLSARKQVLTVLLRARDSDTDPGVDDVLAILLALSSPSLLVVGITLTHGNCPLPAAFANLEKTFYALEREIDSDPTVRKRYPNVNVEWRQRHGAGPIEVYLGSEGPIEGKPVTAKYFHGKVSASGSIGSAFGRFSDELLTLSVRCNSAEPSHRTASVTARPVTRTLSLLRRTNPTCTPTPNRPRPSKASSPSLHDTTRNRSRTSRSVR